MTRNRKPAPTPIAGSQLPFGSPKQLSDGGTKTLLVQKVYETIMESLDAGVLQPGSRIVASDMAAKLGLSRAPVREALAVLAGQGLVELLPDRGAMLRPMSSADIVQIYEVSAPIVAVGLRAAAARIAEGDNAARVMAAMEAVRAAGGEADPGVQFYLVLNEYHYIVNEIAERPIVDKILRAINIEYWNRFLVAAIDLRANAPKYVRNYQRMTDAILDGDGATAEAVMRFHADWCVQLLTD